MKKPQVTIIVVPRERFSYTRASLESIYNNTRQPFSLVYVDGNSPKNVQEYLKQKSQENNFRLIRTEHYLSPNKARNLALAAVNTEYTVFIDNDVCVESGWLEKLMNCAQETDATVVCPLVCIDRELTPSRPTYAERYPLGQASGETPDDADSSKGGACIPHQESHSKVHLAGGEARIYIEIRKEGTYQKIREKYYFTNLPVAEVKDQLQRRECELAQFHAMLVRTDIFEIVGKLDEKLLSTKEDVDFCLTVLNARKEIYCEPDSVVTYVPAKNLALSDIPYFQLRWSDAWELSSIKHFRKKWDITEEDKYFKKRHKNLGYRRHKTLLHPIVKQLSFGGYATWLETLLVAGERKINRYISDRFSVNSY
ncbi:glycosyltransferase [Hyella patelloides]